MPEGSMGHDAEMDAIVESAGMTEDTWITKEGEEIKYEDLTDSHLANIISYLHRCERGMHPGPTSEAASDAWNYELAQLESKIEDLESERDRRERDDLPTPTLRAR